MPASLRLGVGEGSSSPLRNPEPNVTREREALESRARHYEALAESAQQQGNQTMAAQHRASAARLRERAVPASPGPPQPVRSVRADRLTEHLLPAIRYHFIYSLGGLVVGLACVVSGVLLFFHGVTGSTSWIGSFIGAQSKLADAAPGTVLFVVGLFVIWATRFEIQIGVRHSSPR